MFCPNCNKELDGDYNFCPYCKVKLKETDISQEEMNHTYKKANKEEALPINKGLNGVIMGLSSLALVLAIIGFNIVLIVISVAISVIGIILFSYLRIKGFKKLSNTPLMMLLSALSYDILMVLYIYTIAINM